MARFQRPIDHPEVIREPRIAAALSQRPFQPVSYTIPTDLAESRGTFSKFVADALGDPALQYQHALGIPFKRRRD